MTLLDGSRNYEDASDREMVQPIPPAWLPSGRLPVTPSPQEEVPCSETTTEKRQIGIDDLPTLMQPAANIDESPTAINLETTYRVLPYFSMPDGLAIDEQPTWMIPVVRGTREMAEHRSKTAETEGHVSLIRNLFKSSAIYALSSVASPLVSLVLAPFLTRSLSHSDYGALVVLNTVIALMAGVTQLGLSNAFFRAYSYDYESQRDRLRVLSTVVALLLLISIPITIAVMGTASWLAELLFKNSSLSGSVRFVALVVLLQNLTVPGFSWLRAENRAMLFSFLSIVNLLVTLSATIILVGVLHMGIAGSLLAVGGGYAVVVVGTLPAILLRAGLRLHFDVTRNLLSFGIPLVASFVSIWVLQLSDRYLLSRLGSLAETASYGVAYSLGGVISVIVLSPFSLAWPTAMFAIAKRDDAPYVFQLVFRWFSIALLFITFAFSLISMGMLFLFFPPAYHSAAPIIPIVAASTMFYGFYNFFTTGIGIRRKTWLAVIFSTFSALLNVGLNIALIPHYGSIGAALSTLVAYAVLVLIAYVVNQRIYYIPYKLGIFITALSVGIALYIAGSFLARTQQIFVASAIYMGILAIYGTCLVMLAGPLMLINKYKYWRTQEDSRL